MLAETAIDQGAIVDAIRGATENVFSTMMDLAVESLEPTDHEEPGAVDGVVSLSRIHGSMDRHRHVLLLGGLRL